MSRALVPLALVAGVVLVAAGAGMIYLPAGVIAAGVALTLAALDWGRP